MMTMIGLNWEDAKLGITVLNPDDDTANLNTQSAQKAVTAALASETRSIEGDTAQVLRWACCTDGQRLLALTAALERQFGDSAACSAW